MSGRTYSTAYYDIYKPGVEVEQLGNTWNPNIYSGKLSYNEFLDEVQSSGSTINTEYRDLYDGSPALEKIFVKDKTGGGRRKSGRRKSGRRKYSKKTRKNRRKVRKSKRKTRRKKTKRR